MCGGRREGHTRGLLGTIGLTIVGRARERVVAPARVVEEYLDAVANRENGLTRWSGGVVDHLHALAATEIVVPIRCSVDVHRLVAYVAGVAGYEVGVRGPCPVVRQAHCDAGRPAKSLTSRGVWDALEALVGAVALAIRFAPRVVRAGSDVVVLKKLDVLSVSGFARNRAHLARISRGRNEASRSEAGHDNRADFVGECRTAAALSVNGFAIDIDCTEDVENLARWSIRSRHVVVRERAVGRGECTNELSSAVQLALAGIRDADLLCVCVALQGMHTAFYAVAVVEGARVVVVTVKLGVGATQIWIAVLANGAGVVVRAIGGRVQTTSVYRVRVAGFIRANVAVVADRQARYYGAALLVATVVLEARVEWVVADLVDALVVEAGVLGAVVAVVTGFVIQAATRNGGIGAATDRIAEAAALAGARRIAYDGQVDTGSGYRVAAALLARASGGAIDQTVGDAFVVGAHLQGAEVGVGAFDVTFAAIGDGGELTVASGAANARVEGA